MGGQPVVGTRRKCQCAPVSSPVRSRQRVPEPAADLEHVLADRRGFFRPVARRGEVKRLFEVEHVLAKHPGEVDVGRGDLPEPVKPPAKPSERGRGNQSSTRPAQPISPISLVVEAREDQLLRPFRHPRSWLNAWSDSPVRVKASTSCVTSPRDQT